MTPLVERLASQPPVVRDVLELDAVELVLDRDTILWTILMLGTKWEALDPKHLIIKRLRAQLAELRVNPQPLDLEV